ncbi:SERTA domain-containing protein 4 isoform X2 [Syngnathoides biaculeatus]|uniref:SERTA domain-containing protein 4 isoform X2 n=1 Tax=Syngnathoides biaculeatus TaxID=300417 RepID=UPI002ADE4CAA|nr:SERTA domain-containing protein 4 isoform X2 [Syngnathoides biaculeatus]
MADVFFFSQYAVAINRNCLQPKSVKEMTLVLSMNAFLESEGETPIPTYQPIWKTERYSKTCLSNTTSPGHTEHRLKQEPFRRLPDHVSMSRTAYFKRKFVDDDEASFNLRTYCQTVAPILEEQAHVLRLSLEKMRFIDDPEAFLRRSVLVNNLLRRIRADILLQSTEWCLSPNPVFTTVLPPSSNPRQQTHNRSVPTRICSEPQARPPYRKRFRMVRPGQGDLHNDCAQTCCCIYAAAAATGRYLHLPLSMYDPEFSAPHSSSFFQMGSHHKLGLTIIDGHDDEDPEEEDEIEEENEEEEIGETRLPGPSTDLVKDTSRQKSSMKTTRCHADTRTETEITGSFEVQEEDNLEEEAHSIRPCHWDSDAEGLVKVHCWQRKGQRQ